MVSTVHCTVYIYPLNTILWAFDQSSSADDKVEYTQLIEQWCRLTKQCFSQVSVDLVNGPGFFSPSLGNEHFCPHFSRVSTHEQVWPAGNKRKGRNRRITVSLKLRKVQSLMPLDFLHWLQCHHDYDCQKEQGAAAEMCFCGFFKNFLPYFHSASKVAKQQLLLYTQFGRRFSTSEPFCWL